MNRTLLPFLLLLAPALLAPACVPAPAAGGELELRVNVGGRVRGIALEEYVGGVVLAEVGPTWPAEALKAMAVCARTFALNRAAANAGRPWHLVAGVSDQVYRDGYRKHICGG